jgi:hypothetical protein
VPPYQLYTTVGGTRSWVVDCPAQQGVAYASDQSRARLFSAAGMVALFFLGRANAIDHQVNDLAVGGFFNTPDLEAGFTREATGLVSTTYTGPDHLTVGRPRGLAVVFAPTVSSTPTVQVFDPVAGTYADVLGASAVSATAYYALHPEVVAAPALAKVVVLSFASVARWHFGATWSGSSSATFYWTYVP